MTPLPIFLRTASLAICLCLAAAGSLQAQGTMLAHFPDEVKARDVVLESENGVSTEILATRRSIPSETLSWPRPDRRTVAMLQADARRLLLNPPTTLKGETDLACTAVAIFHEARGEPLAGQKAVASVVLQRALVPDRWGDHPCEVVRPVQFSFMTSEHGFPRIDREAGWRIAWARALGVAARALLTGPMPELMNADHYHATYVAPYWKHAMPKVAQIGKHVFYADPISEERLEFQ